MVDDDESVETVLVLVVDDDDEFVLGIDGDLTVKKILLLYELDEVDEHREALDEIDDVLCLLE